MDDDFNNVVVLTVFAGCLVTVIVGYLLAWRSKRTRYRKAGSLVTAAVAGFAGLVMSAWLMGAVTPTPDAKERVHSTVALRAGGPPRHKLKAYAIS
jgi:hypothetical protein